MTEASTGDVREHLPEGRTTRVKAVRGITYLAFLLRHPGREVPATELAEIGEKAKVSGRPQTNGGAGQATPERVARLDPTGSASYRTQLLDLREELDEAERRNDAGQVERLRGAVDVLTHEIVRTVSVAGGERRAGTKAERARVNVTRALAAALQRIDVLHPSLGEHLRRTVRTGTFC